MSCQELPVQGHIEAPYTLTFIAVISKSKKVPQSTRLTFKDLPFQLCAVVLSLLLVLHIGGARMRWFFHAHFLAELPGPPLVGECSSGLFHVVFGGQEVVFLVQVEGSAETLE